MGNCSLTAATDASAAAQGLHGFSTAADGKTGNGVWKVKLVIDPKELEQILSEEVNTEALIQRMRIAAKSTPVRRKRSCGGGCAAISRHRHIR